MKILDFIKKGALLKGKTCVLAGMGMIAFLAGPLSAQTIHAVMHAPLRALDPIISTAYIVRNYGYMVYDTLLAEDSAGNPQPQMASWTVSGDGKTYTFTLRDGLQWHDGNPVTPEDCIASIKRWNQADKLGQLMDGLLLEMKPVDDRSFTMTFSEKTAIALTALAKPSGVAPFMMPKAAAETPVGTAITSVIGSGPFTFNTDQYKPGVQAVFDKFEGYVPRSEAPDNLAGGKVVKVDRVVWTSMPDDMTAVNALLSGEIDFIETVPHELLPVLKNSPDLVLDSYARQGMQSLARLNHRQPPFDNVKIRQAALLAMGQQEMQDAQVGAGSEYGIVCPAVFGCASPYASDYGADISVKAQPEKAKALLTEAGYDGTPIVLLGATDSAQLKHMGPVIAQLLRNGGFNVQLQSMDWASVVARRVSKAPLDQGGWSVFGSNNFLVDVGSPMSFIGVAAGGDSAWFGWPDVPAIEAARAKMARSSSPEEIKALAQEIHRLVIDNVVMIPMGEYRRITAKRKSLADQIDAPVPVFWNMSKPG